MAKASIPQSGIDLEAAQSLGAYWLRRIADTNPFGTEDFIDCAAVSCFAEELNQAHEARMSAELIFGEGVDFGFKFAIAIVLAGLGNPGTEAVTATRQGLLALIEDAIKDRAMEAGSAA